MTKYIHTFCPQCGANIKVDEDGCCTMCGATATGRYISLLDDIFDTLYSRDKILGNILLAHILAPEGLKERS